MTLQPIHLADTSYWRNLAKEKVIENGRRMKVFIDTTGSQDSYSHYGELTFVRSLSIEPFRRDFIEDTITRLGGEVDISFEYVNTYKDANLRFLMVSDDSISSGGLAASNFDEGYQADIVFRSGERIRAQGSNWWQQVIVHELGHAVNLEHPFNDRDGDVYGSEYSTSKDETIMAYGSPSEWGRYHKWFTEVGVEALHSIWGKPEYYSPEFRGASYTVGENYRLDLIKDYGGNLHGGADPSKVKNSYFAQGNADINNDGYLEAVLTNKDSGRWASVQVDSFSKLPVYDDFGESGGTRIVGIYDDPLVLSGGVEKGSPHDSQVRFQNDLYNDNLRLGSAADVDNDGFGEVFWETTDGSAFLRSIHHLDGNVKYANYMNAGQMTDYLSQHGHMGDIGSSLGL